MADSLETTFNSIQNEGRFRGPTRGKPQPYQGQTGEQFAAQIRSDSNIFPTIEDDAVVFKLAYDDGFLDTSHFGRGPILDFLNGETSLAELQAAFPGVNPFYRIFQRVVAHRDGNHAMIEENMPKWAQYYDQAGFVQFYHVFVRKNSSLYMAHTGEIPLTPELFHHGISAYMDQRSEVLHRFRRSDIDYTENPLGLMVEDTSSILGWSPEALRVAIRKFGDATFPRYLCSRKRWYPAGGQPGDGSMNEEVISEFHEKYNPQVSNPAKGRTVGVYGNFHALSFSGHLSGDDAFNGRYPVLPPDSPFVIWPPKNERIQAKDLKKVRPFICPTANLVFIYQHLMVKYYKDSIPRNPIPQTIEQILNEDVQLYPGVYHAEFHTYFHDREIPRSYWYQLTTLANYRRLVRDPVRYAGFIAATAARLGIPYDPENPEETCYQINQVIMNLVERLRLTPSSSTPTSSSRRSLSPLGPRPAPLSRLPAPTTSRVVRPSSRLEKPSTRVQRQREASIYTPRDLDVVRSPPPASTRQQPSIRQDPLFGPGGPSQSALRSTNRRQIFTPPRARTPPRAGGQS